MNDISWNCTPVYYVPVDGDPCPMCGCDIIDAYERFYEFWGHDMVRVQCRRCNLTTAEHANLTLALIFWNTRVKPSGIWRIRTIRHAKGR
jgi:hypothetical protein